jgi:hypothetical protein
LANPSIQSQVIAQAVATLAGAGISAFRTRMTAFSSHQLPAANVMPDEGQALYSDTNSIDRIFHFKVRYTAQAVDECDAAVDAVYVSGSKALLADPKMGGLVIFLRELEQKWEMEKGELDTVALVVTYETQFSTTRSDPSVSCP